MEIFELLAVFFVGILASMFGAMIGGGTLLSLPFLMLIGLPAPVAVATERFGGLGQTAASFVKFARSQKIMWPFVPLLTIISVVGSIIGAQILVTIDVELLHNAIGVILLLLLPLTFLKRSVGIEHNKVGRRSLIVGSILYFFVQIFAAFFGGGTGILVAYTLMFCFGLTVLEASATKIIPWFFLSVTSLVIFALNDLINYQLGIVLLLGMTIGGYLGAHIALKKGDAWIKYLFYGLVIVTVAKLLMF